MMGRNNGDQGKDVVPNADKLARISRAILSFDIRKISRGQGQPRLMLLRRSGIQVAPPTGLVESGSLSMSLGIGVLLQKMTSIQKPSMSKQRGLRK